MLDDAALAKLQDVRRRGDWAALDAAELSLERLSHSPLLMLNLARARVRQGLLNHTRDALFASYRGSSSPGEQLVIYLEVMALRCRTELAVRAALSDARTALDSASPDIGRADLADARRLEARLAHTALIFYEGNREKSRTAHEILPSIADILEEEGRSDEAWSARHAYARRHGDRPVRHRLALSELATHAEQAGRLDIAADVAFEVARSLIASGASSDEVHQALDHAAKLYAKAEHCVGPIHVRATRASLAIRRERAHLALVEPELEALIRAKDHAHEASLLLDLAGIAAERGLLREAATYRQRLTELVKYTGDGMVLNSVRVAVIDNLVRLADFGRAIEFCEEALSQPLPEVCQANYHQLLGTTYGQLRDPRAISHLERAVSIFEAVGARAQASAAFTVLASRLATSGRSADLSRARTILSDRFDHDVRDGRSDDAFRNRVQQAHFELNQARSCPVGSQARLADAETALAQAEQLLNGRPLSEVVGEQASLSALRGEIAHARGDNAELERYWADAIEGYRSARLDLEAAGLSYTLGCHELNRARGSDLLTYFPRAEEHLNFALRYYLASGMREWSADTRLMLAQLWANASAAPHVGREAANAMLSGALMALSDAEADWDAVRSDFAAGSTLGVQSVKQSFGRRSRAVYSLAFRVLNHRGAAAEIWDWTQRSKARGLADTIGLTSSPPSAVVERVREDPTSHARLVRELELVERSRRVSAADKPTLTRELAELRGEMQSDPNLAEYLALRGGRPVTRAELGAILPAGTVCVDWIAVGDRLTLVALRPGGEPAVFPLDLNVARAFEFVAKNLGPASFRQTLREAPSILRALDVLVAPLAQCSLPGEVLVFSPTAPIHAVPLHALHLEGQPLIYRNPVSYVPSMTVLKHCVLRREGVPTVTRAAFVGDPLGDRPDSQRIADVLTKAWGARAVSGSGVTQAAFAALLEGHDLFHYQGHARYDGSDALGSYLPFAGQARFTARDLYELKQVPRELVTLAACETATLAVNAGDEPLGFIPALLVSGARTVVAALWPAHSPATTEIMCEFYAQLRTGLGKAAALQTALLRMAQQAPTLGATDFSKPYYWAPFVLHGDWR